MRYAIAILVALMIGTAAHAQGRGDFTGPFTGYEAQTLSEVWPDIRKAAHFEDINWSTHGLSRAPGSSEAQRILSANWEELRREEHFADIDWNEYSGNRSASARSRTERYGRAETGFPDEGGYRGSPFAREDFEDMSRVWSEIRVAARFEDINWRTHGLSRAPGSAEAQRILSTNWNELRREERFTDIDWDEYSAYSGSTGRYGRADSGSVGYHNSPYSEEDFEDLSRVWGQIRQAAHYEDINWRGLGLSGPPGDQEARRLTSRYWNDLRKAAHFEDINWQVTTGYHAR